MICSLSHSGPTENWELINGHRDLFPFYFFLLFFSIYMYYPLLQTDECWISSDKHRSADNESIGELNQLRISDIQEPAMGSVKQQVAGGNTIWRQTCCSTSIKYSAAYVSLFFSDELPKHEPLQVVNNPVCGYACSL